MSAQSFTVLLHVPASWSERQTEILAERLVGSELPPGVAVECAYWDHDEQGYSPWWSDESR